MKHMKHILLAIVVFWTSQSFTTVTDMINKMNTLEPQQQLESKVLYANQNPQPYILIYKENVDPQVVTQTKEPEKVPFVRIKKGPAVKKVIRGDIAV